MTPSATLATKVTGQEQLFSDDYSQPDAADGEPVFWSDRTVQPFPADNFVQADVPEAG